MNKFSGTSVRLNFGCFEVFENLFRLFGAPEIYLDALKRSTFRHLILKCEYSHAMALGLAPQISAMMMMMMMMIFSLSVMVRACGPAGHGQGHGTRCAVRAVRDTESRLGGL